MIKISTSGSFKDLENHLDRVKEDRLYRRLEQYGREGVDALSRATPLDSGLTAASWTYSIIRQNKRYTIRWDNTHVVSGAKIAILLQYGHATGTGGWVEGREYINAAIKPVFDRIASDVWREVTKNA